MASCTEKDEGQFATNSESANCAIVGPNQLVKIDDGVSVHVRTAKEWLDLARADLSARSEIVPTAHGSAAVTPSVLREHVLGPRTMSPREAEVIAQPFVVSRERLLQAINGGGSFEVADFSPEEIEATLRLALRAKFAPSATPARAFEEQPFAWAVRLKSGVESLVYHHPIEERLDLQEGDVACPLFREVYTQEALDQAAREADELHKGLRIE